MEGFRPGSDLINCVFYKDNPSCGIEKQAAVTIIQVKAGDTGSSSN